MNLSYFFNKDSFFRKLMFWFIAVVFVGVVILLLKHGHSSLSPAAKRMFDAISVNNLY